MNPETLPPNPAEPLDETAPPSTDLPAFSEAPHDGIPSDGEVDAIARCVLIGFTPAQARIAVATQSRHLADPKRFGPAPLFRDAPNGAVPDAEDVVEVLRRIERGLDARTAREAAARQVRHNARPVAHELARNTGPVYAGRSAPLTPRTRPAFIPRRP